MAIVAGAIALASSLTLAAQMGLNRAQPIVGGVVILGLAYVFSTNRRAIHLPTVARGLALQILFALIVLKTGFGQRLFSTLGDWITKLLSFALIGAEFVFGPLAAAPSGAKSRRRFGPAARGPARCIPRVAPTIIFVAALFAILYYFGIMQYRRPGLRVC